MEDDQSECAVRGRDGEMERRKSESVSGCVDMQTSRELLQSTVMDFRQHTGSCGVGYLGLEAMSDIGLSSTFFSFIPIKFSAQTVFLTATCGWCIPAHI